MKKIHPLIWLIVCTLIVAKCNKDEPGQQGSSLMIKSITPASGTCLTAVKIVGKTWSSDKNEYTVKFNGVEAEIVDLLQDTIVVEVPKGAGTGPVTVSVNGKNATGPVFNYIKQLMVSNVTGGIEGYKDGAASSARFKRPQGILSDSVGNIYISDTDNQRIRKLSADGTVTTVAGSDIGYMDALGINARFQYPMAMAQANNLIYVTDLYNHKIRVIDQQGEVKTLTGKTPGLHNGNINVALFKSPCGIAIDKNGNIYVADYENHLIRKITPGGIVSTFAGSTMGFANGFGNQAKFIYPFGITIDKAGNLYVSDRGNNCIRKISPVGEVSVLAGSNIPAFVDGSGSEARFSRPSGITINDDGYLFVADTYNNRIRKISPDGRVITIAGSVPGNIDGPALQAQLNQPLGICFDKKGVLYVTDNNSRIRKIIEE